MNGCVGIWSLENSENSGWSSISASALLKTVTFPSEESWVGHWEVLGEETPAHGMKWGKREMNNLLNWKGNGDSDMVFLLNLSYFISSGCVWTHLVQLSSGSSAVKEKVWSVGVIDWVCMGLSELIYCFNVPVCCGNITYNWGMWLENVWWHTQVKEPSPPFFFSALLVVGLKPDTKSDDKPRFCVLPLKKQQQQQHKSTLEPVGKCRNSSLV